MTSSPITVLRRLIALGIARIGSPIERQLCEAMKSAKRPMLDVSPELQTIVEDGLRILRNRWPFGLRLVERYVEAIIEVGIRDGMGFTSGIWALSSKSRNGKPSPEDVAIQLVRMAMRRKAYLKLGWKGYLMNKRFNQVGLRLIDKARKRIELV